MRNKKEGRRKEKTGRGEGNAVGKKKDRRKGGTGMGSRKEGSRERGEREERKKENSVKSFFSLSPLLHVNVA